MICTSYTILSMHYMHEYFVVNEYQWNLNDLWSPVAHPARWSAHDPNPQMLSIARTGQWYAVICITDFVLPRVENIHLARLFSFPRKQPCNVLTLIACASCAQLLRTEMNYIAVTVETVFWRARSDLEAFPGHTFPYPFILVPGNLLLIPLCNGAVDLK